MPQPRAPEPPTWADAEAALDAEAVLDEEPVLVTFIADTPWGNAGETLLGTWTRMENGQYTLCVDDEFGMSRPISQGEPYVRVQELRRLGT